MFGYPPFTRDQRIGTTLTVLGTVIVFVANRYVMYQQWPTYLPAAGGLLLCAIGVYFNTRRRGQHP